MLAAILTFCGNVNSYAQEDAPVVNAYFTTKEMPDMMVFLPGPPDSTSVAFMNDVARYYWGKEMRKNPERAAQATRDGVYGLATILTEFEEAFGMKITEEETPEMNHKTCPSYSPVLCCPRGVTSSA